MSLGFPSHIGLCVGILKGLQYLRCRAIRKSRENAVCIGETEGKSMKDLFAINRLLGILATDTLKFWEGPCA